MCLHASRMQSVLTRLSQSASIRPIMFYGVPQSRAIRDYVDSQLDEVSILGLDVMLFSVFAFVSLSCSLKLTYRQTSCDQPPPQISTYQQMASYHTQVIIDAMHPFDCNPGRTNEPIYE